MRFVDHTNKKYNRLFAVSVHSKRNGKYYWNCICDCGKNAVINGSRLSTGSTKSCGCYNTEVRKRARGSNNECRVGLITKERKAWGQMKQRCYNPNNPGFKNYGGRGITVCDEWRRSYLSFLSHVGRAPSKKHSIDRINNDGNYEPGNVRWATIQQQLNNRRATIRRKKLLNKQPQSESDGDKNL